MDHVLQQIAGVIGMSCYVPLIIGIVRNKIEQSFVAFMLWAMLDIIATITTIIAGGNYWLPLSNAIGASTVAILLATKKQVAWSWVETITAILVVVCLILWYVLGEGAGIVSSSIAVVIASIPQMVDTYKKPWATPTIIYLVFLSANILSLVAGKSWNIEERFYPACAVFLCLVIAAFSMRRTSVTPIDTNRGAN
ncbi:MAG: hypothetical protein H7122_08780 [Chitinophagaceae bacterium]|nr:hypothetical protein [Chitinophagaceae bacterium]